MEAAQTKLVRAVRREVRRASRGRRRGGPDAESASTSGRFASNASDDDAGASSDGSLGDPELTPEFIAAAAGVNRDLARAVADEVEDQLTDVLTCLGEETQKASVLSYALEAGFGVEVPELLGEAGYSRETTPPGSRDEPTPGTRPLVPGAAADRWRAGIVKAGRYAHLIPPEPTEANGRRRSPPPGPLEGTFASPAPTSPGSDAFASANGGDSAPPSAKTANLARDDAFETTRRSAAGGRGGDGVFGSATRAKVRRRLIPDDLADLSERGFGSEHPSEHPSPSLVESVAEAFDPERNAGTVDTPPEAEGSRAETARGPGSDENAWETSSDEGEDEDEGETDGGPSRVLPTRGRPSRDRPTTGFGGSGPVLVEGYYSADAPPGDDPATRLGRLRVGKNPAASPDRPPRSPRGNPRRPRAPPPPPPSFARGARPSASRRRRRRWAPSASSPTTTARADPSCTTSSTETEKPEKEKTPTPPGARRGGSISRSRRRLRSRKRDARAWGRVGSPGVGGRVGEGEAEGVGAVSPALRRVGAKIARAARRGVEAPGGRRDHRAREAEALGGDPRVRVLTKGEGGGEVGVRIALSNAQRDEYLKRVPGTSTCSSTCSLTRLETTDVRSEAHETGRSRVARRRFSRLLDPGRLLSVPVRFHDAVRLFRLRSLALAIAPAPSDNRARAFLRAAFDDVGRGGAAVGVARVQAGARGVLPEHPAAPRRPHPGGGRQGAQRRHLHHRPVHVEGARREVQPTETPAPRTRARRRRSPRIPPRDPKPAL